jgi:hypothetical protein
MIAGYSSREQVEAMLAGLGRELRGHIRDERHRASIKAQIEVFAAELERLGDGDYTEERPVRRGRFAWLNEFGAQQVR